MDRNQQRSDDHSNLVGLALLSGQMVKLKKEYFSNRLPNNKH